MYNTGFNTNYSWMYQPYNYGWNNSMNNFTPYMNLNSTFSFNTNPWNTNYGFQPSFNTQMPIMNTQVNTNSQITTSNPSFTSTKTEESTPKDEEQEGLSTGAKWGIGLSIAAAVAIGVEVFAFKGKHLEKVWNKIKGVADDVPNSSNTPDVPNTPTTPPSGPTTPPSRPSTPPSKPVIPPNIDDGIEFKNLDDAKSWFDSVGIKTDFRPGAESHLEDLNNFKKDITMMEKNGVAMPRPHAIAIGDWHNQTEMKEIFHSLNLPDDATKLAADLDRIGLWGVAKVDKNNQLCVIVNSKFGNCGAFAHEMGHHHQDFGTSFWHNKGLLGDDFMSKQLEILGLPKTKVTYVSGREYFEGKDILQSILRSPTFFNNGSYNMGIIQRHFPQLNKNDFAKVFCFHTDDGKKYILNAKKLIDKMQTETDVYRINLSETYVWEQAAEMFAKLNKGHQFSDEVMLMYDFIGGGRVPNLVIKGQKYDDYIASLYQNKELLQKLRDCIEIKRL